MVPLSNMKDIQNLYPDSRVTLLSSTSSLQFLNIRVSKRLNRYRLLQRQWYKLQSPIQNKPLSTSNIQFRLPMSDIKPLRQEQNTEKIVCDIKDCSIPLEKTIIKGSKEKTFSEFEFLRSQIPQDLLQLRKGINIQQKKIPEITSLKINNKLSRAMTFINTSITEEEDNNIKSLDYAQRADRRIHSATSSQNDNKCLIRSNSPNIFLPNSKRQEKIQQQINNKPSNIYRCRVYQSFISDSPIQSIPSTKVILNKQSKINLKQPQRLNLPLPLTNVKQVDEIQPSTIKQETTTCFYTYATSTSSIMPSSMKLNRNTSLLSILLTPISCLGIQEQHETYVKKSKINSYSLLNYEKVQNHLPKPIISFYSEKNHDGFRILSTQLDRIRETMPNSNVYNNYIRTC
ncbi:unnamed protein product [Adineta steineri]|uniref:Uncharacterized protein n=1 Tax=Adineta steineri TaxID=433720 RepID=A0A814W8D7_9BILA|nr:unnamed protein product [Adineta steineri]CAF1197916.1 unnamed protein product [Adineta steineri]CAF1423774.1 unnamed protein product [Adineta steineri]